MTEFVEDGLFDTEDGRQHADAEPMEREDSIEHLTTSEQDEGVALEDATLEPAARVEATGEFIQGEAIEAALADLVDSTQESAAEGGKRSFGQETGDPSQHYSGVQMTQGAVETDQDWNEGVYPPPTEEAAIDTLGAADVDDRLVEGVNVAASQAIARAFLDEDFRDRLMEDPEAALEEHGLTREDLPDLSNPETPLAEVFMHDVQRRVIEGISQSRGDETGNRQSGDDLSGDPRVLALQMAMDKKDQAEKTYSSVVEVFENTMRDLVANLK